MGNLFEKPAFLFLLLFFVVPVVLLIWLVVYLSRRGQRAREQAHLAASTAAHGAVQPAGSPGWYRQPDGTQRYWDGRAWTDDTAP